MDKKIKNKFLYISKNHKVRVRFIGKQSEMYQYFRNSSVFVNSFSHNNIENLNLWSFFKEKDDGDVNYSKSKRIVSLVVDRADEGVKAFACPISVWNQLVDQTKENDFEIWREGEKLNTKYYVTPLGVSDITEKQEKIAQATLDSFTFSDIFVEDQWELVGEVIEKIENRWEILDL